MGVGKGSEGLVGGGRVDVGRTAKCGWEKTKSTERDRKGENVSV